MDDAAGFQELNTCNMELQLISDAGTVIAYYSSVLSQCAFKSHTRSTVDNDDVETVLFFDNHFWL